VTEREARQAEGLTDESIDELVSVLLTASRVLVGVSARSLGEVEDTVTLTQFRALVVLDGHGSARLNQLASRLEVGPSTAMRTVDRLIAAGFVQRHENARDRREVVIDLTAAGRRLVETVTRRRRAAIEQIVRAMPADHREDLVEALIAFAAAADEPLVAAESATKLGW
jgi:DNA-binding MarR family transcriptional regulator